MPSFYTDWRSNLKRPIFRKVHQLEDWLLRGQIGLRDAVRHVHGPREVSCGEDEMVVLCLMRNGELWIRSYIEHYLALGGRHIVFLDNGSTDDSITLATSYDRVSVWSSDLPFRRYQHAFRRWLTRRFGRNRWALHADVDELWDYPGSETLDLGGFLSYLNEHGYRAVVAQMLDMFADEPFSRLRSSPEDSLKQEYRFYDLADISRRTDLYWIAEANAAGADHFATFGGVRKRFFGSEGLLQTKHPLVYAGRGVEVYPYDGHFVTGAPIADVSTVLLHFKFVGNLREQAEDALRRRQLHGDSRNYRGFYEVLHENPDLCLRTETARELLRVEQLVAEELLVVSARYREWAAAEGREV